MSSKTENAFPSQGKICARRRENGHFSAKHTIGELQTQLMLQRL
jgi:hypothetical protein